MSHWNDKQVAINVFVGKTFKKVTNTGDAITFESDDGTVLEMSHDQDCCEHVRVEDICGDLQDLMDPPIIEAREDTNRKEPVPELGDDSFTWTLYNFRTMKGSVTIRWLGESNGYYSESVEIWQVV